MTEWEPATDAEVAMREALRTDDQESYFRILAGVDLLLPVSADALAGLAPLGWGTWSTGGRTHVLAFTSPSALQACLADYSGSARRVAYQELANTWPNLEWWLAVNPGLPIEGYLPAWFVAQLARGDLRLPTRAGRDSAGAQSPRKAQAGAAGGPTATPPPPALQPATVPAGSPYGSAADRGVAAEGSLATQSAPGGLPMRTPGPVLPTRMPSGQQFSAGQPGHRDPADRELGDRELGDRERADRERADRERADRERADPERADREPADRQPGRPPRNAAPAVAPTSAVPAAYRPPVVPPRPASPAGPASPQGPVSPPGPHALRPPAEAASSPPAQDQFGASAQDQFGSSAQYHGTGLPAQDSWAREQFRPPMPAGTAGGSDPVSSVPAAGGPLPRRPVTPPSERPTSMAAAAQAMAAARAPQPAQPTRPGIVPPVIPGAPGSGHPATQFAGPDGPTPPNTPAQPNTPTTPGFPTSPGPSAPPSRSGVPAAAATPAAVPLTAPPGGHGLLGGHGLPGGYGQTGEGGQTDRDGPTGPASPTGFPGAGPERDDDEFQPANGVEQDLYNAADGGSTDVFLSTLLLATVLIPVGPQSRPGATPGEPGFVYRTEDVDGETYLVVFTSPDRLADHYADPVRTVGMRFFELIRTWPDPGWSFNVNPGSPIGAKLPGAQIIALANWAAEAGLGDDPMPGGRDDDESVTVPSPRTQPDGGPAPHLTVMQKTIPPEQVDYFLDRGYDRVAGFVHRAGEVEHLRTPADLYTTLGLGYAGSPYRRDAKEAYVLRWPAHRPSLYRIPYGGQNEHQLRAMDGWVIERAPFRGHGFAPGESRDVIAEFKVDSARLPHGAQLWRIDADGTERIIAVFDADAPTWRRVAGQ